MSENELVIHNDGELSVLESEGMSKVVEYGKNVMEVSMYAEKLEKSVALANNVLTKRYLAELKQYPIVPVNQVVLSEDLEKTYSQYIRMYKIISIAYDKEEDNLMKLSNVYNALSGTMGSLLVLLDSEPEKISFYIGVRTYSNERLRLAQATLEKTLLGNFPGCRIEKVNNAKMDRLLKNVFVSRDESSFEEHRVISSVSGIASMKESSTNSKKTEFTQGIEKLVDSMRGEVYTVLIIADPIEPKQVAKIRDDYEKLYTTLKPFETLDITLGQNDSNSVTKSIMDGTANTISHSVSNSISHSHTESDTTSQSITKTAGIGIGKKDGVSASASVSVTDSSSHTTSDTTTKTRTTTNGKAETKSINTGLAEAVSSGTSQSIQMKTEERTIKAILEKIDSQLERLNKNGDIGMWNCAAYFISDEMQVANTAATAYYALTKGADSGLEHTAITVWKYDEDQEVDSWDNKEWNKLVQYLKILAHPRFAMDVTDEIIPFVSTSSVLTTQELTVHACLPQKSVPGLQVSEFATFGREVFACGGLNKEFDTFSDRIKLGQICHVGNREETEVELDVNSLCSHTFITGSTGKGKSTAIYSILDKLMVHNVKGKSDTIKFMVIEPAKGEYKNRFGGYDTVHVYGTNYKKTPLLKINPFSFPEDIHVLEHIDRLIEIFNVCWPMYAAMPAVLKDAVEKAYVVAGWNLEKSECRYRDTKGKPLYPSFVDVLQQINKVMDDSAYSADSKGDYKGALCTRLKSLTNGLYGQIFTNDELSEKELFDENVIIDLSRTGSSETKSLIMGLLVMKLQEYRMANAIGGNEPLKHVTVLEEAHNILKRTATEQFSEGSNLLGKAVEMLANSIAEMRTYGEGFIIADQAPGLMDLSVIRNTNTKIILGLPDLADRELVGRAASLNEDQILELSRLKTFVAAVYQNNWLEPVLCNIDTNFKCVPRYTYEHITRNEIDKMEYLEYLLLPIDKRNAIDYKYLDELINGIYMLQIPSEAKVAFMRYTKAETKDEIQKLRGQVAYSLFNTEIAFGLAKGKESNISSWYDCIKEMLEPNIMLLNEHDQQKIIALLTKEQARIDGKAETTDLYKRFMDHI